MRLLEKLSRHHFPNPPATLAEIVEFEQRVGWRMDSDLRAFYLHCNGAKLFEQPDSPYRILPLDKIIRARVAMRGEDSDEWGPASWYVLCDLHDNDRILVNVDRTLNARHPIIDGWNEGFSHPEDCKQIAGSFSEFLEAALSSGGRKFWLKQGGS
ncbi:SMI1/KNR4 family protein [Archangium lipolyticum]|uniref:SMI1/KNR4 family protein n=1 Tax=Archangium lipolyticum TaxID=2970465 RepID=UPI00214A6C1C|nr:SMI1/KNR4 family protein [Archangium lipolyticum]